MSDKSSRGGLEVERQRDIKKLKGRDLIEGQKERGYRVRGRQTVQERETDKEGQKETIETDRQTDRYKLG